MKVFSFRRRIEIKLDTLSYSTSLFVNVLIGCLIGIRNTKYRNETDIIYRVL